MNTSLKKKNFAYSTLNSAIDATSVSVTLVSGDGSLLPQDGPFMAVLWDASYSFPSQDTSREIVRCTWQVDDTFTIERAKEGTVAKSWSAGTHFAIMISKSYLEELDDRGINAKIYGTTLDDTTISAALVDIGSDKCVLVLTPGDWDIQSNLTIPSNIILDVVPGVNLKSTTSSTLTIEGFLKAGRYQIFDSSLTVVGLSKNEFRYSEWFGSSGFITFTNGDTTPSVLKSNWFKTANTGATSITTFDDGASGQKVVVVFGDVNTTIVHGSGIYLKGGVSVTPNVNTSLSFIFDGTDWFEI